MAKESTYPTATLASGDYLRGVDDPGGTPSTKNFEVNATNADVLFGLSKAGGLGDNTSDKTSASYELVASDFGKTVIVDYASVFSLEVPNGLPDGFFCHVYQKGAGKVQATATGTASVTGKAAFGDELVQTNGEKTLMTIRQIASDSYCCFGYNLSIPDFLNTYSINSTAQNNSHRLDLGDNLTFLNSATQFTLAGWFKKKPGAQISFFEFASGYGYLTSASNQIILYLGTGGVLGSGGFPSIAGGWHFLAASFNAGSMDFHVDNAKVSTSTSYPSAASSTFGNTPRMGAASGSRYLGDNVDCFGIWDTNLSTAELTELYNGGSVRSYGLDYGNYTSSANLRRWWRCGDQDDTSGTTITEAMGNSGNNATLVGAGVTFQTDVP